MVKYEIKFDSINDAYKKALPFIRNCLDGVLYSNNFSYSDNPKVISEYLYETRPDIVQVWAFKNPNTVNIPKYIKKVKYGSLNMFREALTSRVWVDNGTKAF